MFIKNDRLAPAAVIALAVLALSLGALPRAEAAEPGPFDLSLAQADTEETSEPMAERTDITVVEEEDEEWSSPFGFGLSYAIYSDYIFRGFNFSEYGGEGREKLNHQLTVSTSFDLSSLGFGDLGTIGFDTWFEWFAGQKRIDPSYGGQNLQEVDFVLYWAYSIEPIATDVAVGFTFYNFPNLAYTLRLDEDPNNNDKNHSYEYWISLEHNDAWMWTWLFPDNEDGVLNPSFLYAQDVWAFAGAWFELGVSHDFAIPGVDNLTITPGAVMLIDSSYWSHGTKMAGAQLSLVTEYDLTPVLQLPPWAGSITVTGDLYFNDAWGNLENNGVIQDEFWGGMTVNWSWGG